MKLAIQGCSHGELDAIYASLLRTEREQSLQIDALLLCGDFQAIRNHSDLHALAVPQKYLQLGDFHSYYSGEKVAPILTLVIGGNHEASNYMHELYHGGWLAPNIYFLGAAGVVELNGLVVAGISGIYKDKDYKKGRFEKLPYDASTIRSCYHTREFDVARLKALASTPVDVAMSHDWPNTIEQWGDTKALIRKKPFFKDEIESETLGSPPLMELLQCLKPSFWFSAHLHVKFAALFKHGQASPSGGPSTSTTTAAAANANPEALDISLDSDDDDEEKEPTPQAPSETENKAESSESSASATTRFLALHKCLPQTPFLQIIDHPSPHDAELEARKAALNYQERISPTLRYHKRWLAITRAFHSYFSLQYRQPYLPDPSSASLLERVEQEERWIEQNRLARGATKNSGKRKQDELDGSIAATAQAEEEGESGEELDVYRVQQFVRTAPAPFEPGGLSQAPPAWYTNPQTEAFCHFVGIENRINPRPAHFAPAGFYPPPHFPHQAQEMHQAPAAQDQGTGMREEMKSDPNALAIDMDDLDSDCDHDGEAGAAAAADEARGVVTLSDDDELHARWKEGTG
ncbi:related to lariat-debranching enzyme [Sporisorium reilianum SRZ2]|uniref:Related to lariat-debranching enzyme n=1 Tax=Sporisorium reilianum (strain SRZ2) TaxID=999809 RepID=E6ZT71_SPORE|nr:related to lariat-debranching enzyme [Sporisorium reilianum SRZ2]